jgi:anaerobic magnesium-protoporphyrin IX monomethyl ester cyclase
MKRAILCFPYVTSRQTQYPTGLYKIATFCKQYYDVVVLDQRIHTDVIQKMSRILGDNDDVLCLGLSVMTGEQIASAIKISEEMHSRIKIVWGGMHPTILPKQTLENDFVDFVVIGEGERAFLNLLTYLDGQRSNRELFLSKDNDNYSYNYISDLDGTEYIDFNKYPIDERYFVRRDGFERAFTLETSRGCPHRCYFCHNSVHKTPYRFLSWERIVEIIDFLKRHYEIDGVAFQEDNFFANIKRVRGIVNFLILERDIGWKANSRIDYFRRLVEDLEFMEMLVLSGCKMLQFGVESGSERILKMINKRIDLGDVVSINRKLAEYPIRVRYNFMIGFPTETVEDMNKTFELIDELRKDNSNMEPPFLNIYTPYPGTPLYCNALKCGFPEPDSTEGWINCTWNKVSVDWLSPDLKEVLEELSRAHFGASNYLKGSSRSNFAFLPTLSE